jgi:hypothetical protein
MYKAGAVHPNVTTKQWKLVVTPLSGTTPLHQFEFEGGNWMAALRDARHELGEDGGLPSGASCTVAPDGTVTILDPEARRKFLLTPISKPLVVQRAGERAAEPVANAKFQTVGYSKDQLAGALSQAKGAQAAAGAAPQAPQLAAGAAARTVARPNASQAAAALKPSAAAEAREPVKPAAQTAARAVVSQPRTPIKRIDTADYEDRAQQAKGPALSIGGPEPQAAAAREVQIVAPAALELLITRDVDPTSDNPLSYRERAYLMPAGIALGEAEAALRSSLAELQRTLESAPRGKFVNLAVFDHSWTDRPQRPPLVAVEWRDWRGEPVVDYPASEEEEEPPFEGDERLTTVFEALHELAHLRTAAEGLEFAVRLLGHAVPAEALSAALYDINTDELRFVAVIGKNSDAMQGRAVGRTRGLFGRAAQLDHTALVIDEMSAEPSFDAQIDGRPGLATRNALLRSVATDGRLLGMLQILNRSGSGFTAADVHLINYVAERLAEYLRDARARVRA